MKPITQSEITAALGNRSKIRRLIARAEELAAARPAVVPVVAPLERVEYTPVVVWGGRKRIYSEGI